jgi:hypothetical protein
MTMVGLQAKYLLKRAYLLNLWHIFYKLSFKCNEREDCPQVGNPLFFTYWSVLHEAYVSAPQTQAEEHPWFSTADVNEDRSQGAGPSSGPREEETVDKP